MSGTILKGHFLQDDGRKAISRANLIPNLCGFLHNCKDDVQKGSVHLLARLAQNCELVYSLTVILQVTYLQLHYGMKSARQMSSQLLLVL